MDGKWQYLAALFGADMETAGSKTKELKALGKNAAESSELARIARDNGNYNLAIELWGRALEQADGSSMTDILRQMGDTYETIEEHGQAYRQYLRALQSDSADTDAQLSISEVLRRSGRQSEAIQALQAALATKPEDSYLHYKLADGYLCGGYPQAALKPIQNAILLQPDNHYYYFWMAELLAKLGKYEEAVDAYRAAIDLSPGDGYYYLRLAISFWRAGKQADSIKAVRLASDLDPESHFYHGLLEALYEEQNLLVDANLEAERADMMDAYDIQTVSETLAEMGISQT